MDNTQPTEVNIQVELAIIQFKIQLLTLAKDIVKERQIRDNVIDVYLDLREEVLGIPNPKNQKENGTKD